MLRIFITHDKKLLIYLMKIQELDLKLFTKKKKKKKTVGTGLKLLPPKQMVQWLPIALAQVKAGSNSEGLLNEIGEIVYSLYESK